MRDLSCTKQETDTAGEHFVEFIVEVGGLPAGQRFWNAFRIQFCGSRCCFGLDSSRPCFVVKDNRGASHLTDGFKLFCRTGRDLCSFRAERKRENRKHRVGEGVFQLFHKPGDEVCHAASKTCTDKDCVHFTDAFFLEAVGYTG